MNYNIQPSVQLRLHPARFVCMYFVSQPVRAAAPHAQPPEQGHRRFDAVYGRVRGRYESMIEFCPLLVLGSDSLPPRQAGVDETCRPAVKINDCIKAPREKPRASRIFPARNQYLVEIRIAVEAAGKPGFHEHCDSKGGEFFLQGENRPRQQQAVSH